MNFFSWKHLTVCIVGGEPEAMAHFTTKFTNIKANVVQQDRYLPIWWPKCIKNTVNSILLLWRCGLLSLLIIRIGREIKVLILNAYLDQSWRKKNQSIFYMPRSTGKNAVYFCIIWFENSIRKANQQKCHYSSGFLRR